MHIKITFLTAIARTIAGFDTQITIIDNREWQNLEDKRAWVQEIFNLGRELSTVIVNEKLTLAATVCGAR